MDNEVIEFLENAIKAQEQNSLDEFFDNTDFSKDYVQEAINFLFEDEMLEENFYNLDEGIALSRLKAKMKQLKNIKSNIARGGVRQAYRAYKLDNINAKETKERYKDSKQDLKDQRYENKINRKDKLKELKAERKEAYKSGDKEKFLKLSQDLDSTRKYSARKEYKAKKKELENAYKNERANVTTKKNKDESSYTYKNQKRKEIDSVVGKTAKPVKPENKPEPKPSQPKLETKPERKPTTKSENKSKPSQPKLETKPEPQPKPENKPNPQPEVKPEPQPENNQKQPENKPSASKDEKPETAGDYEKIDLSSSLSLSDLNLKYKNILKENGFKDSEDNLNILKESILNNSVAIVQIPTDASFSNKEELYENILSNNNYEITENNLKKIDEMVSEGKLLFTKEEL